MRESFKSFINGFPNPDPEKGIWMHPALLSHFNEGPKKLVGFCLATLMTCQAIKPEDEINNEGWSEFTWEYLTRIALFRKFKESKSYVQILAETGIIKIRDGSTPDSFQIWIDYDQIFLITNTWDDRVDREIEEMQKAIPSKRNADGTK